MKPNDRIRPETPLRVLLEAQDVPEFATVSKRTGETTFFLRREILLYTHRVAGAKEILATGHFLCSPNGNVDQIAANQLILWHITALDFVDELQASWRGGDQ